MKAERPLKDDEKDAGAMYAKATFVKAERPLKDDQKAEARSAKPTSSVKAERPLRDDYDRDGGSEDQNCLGRTGIFSTTLDRMLAARR